MTEKKKTTYEKLCDLSVPRANVTKMQYLFPNGHETKNLVTTEPFNIPFESLEQLKSDENNIVNLYLECGSVEIYGCEDAPQTRHVPAFFEAVVDGKEVSGISVGDLTADVFKDPNRKEFLLKNKKTLEKYLKELRTMEVVKDSDAVLS
jgi:hypothetical protein